MQKSKEYYLIMQYQTLYQHLPLASLVCYANGRIIEANKPFYDLIKYNFEEIVDKFLDEYLQADIESEIFAYLGKAASGVQDNFECELLTKTSVKRVILKLIPAMYQETVTGIFAIFLEGTGNLLEENIRIKQLEGKLKLTVWYLKKVQELAKIGIWEMDLNTFQNYFSKQTRQIYGIEEEGDKQNYNDFLKIVHPDDVAMIQNLMDKPPRLPVFDMEYRIIRPDGKVRKVYQIVEVIYNWDKHPVSFTGIIQDITEKKKV